MLTPKNRKKEEKEVVTVVAEELPEVDVVVDSEEEGDVADMEVVTTTGLIKDKEDTKVVMTREVMVVDKADMAVDKEVMAVDKEDMAEVKVVMGTTANLIALEAMVSRLVDRTGMAMDSKDNRVMAQVGLVITHRANMAVNNLVGAGEAVVMDNSNLLKCI